MISRALPISSAVAKKAAGEHRLKLGHVQEAELEKLMLHVLGGLLLWITALSVALVAALAVLLILAAIGVVVLIVAVIATIYAVRRRRLHR